MCKTTVPENNRVSTKLQFLTETIMDLSDDEVDELISLVEQLERQRLQRQHQYPNHPSS